MCPLYGHFIILFQPALSIGIGCPRSYTTSNKGGAPSEGKSDQQKKHHKIVG